MRTIRCIAAFCLITLNFWYACDNPKAPTENILLEMSDQPSALTKQIFGVHPTIFTPLSIQLSMLIASEPTFNKSEVRWV